MIEKELSPEQIDHLFEFVRKKKVKYVDCQYELVDHLASAIEEEMDVNPSITFENALNNVYKRFGKLKFYKFVKEKEKGLQKYWERKTWDFIKRFFVLPRILLTFVLFTSTFYILYNYKDGFKLPAVLCVIAFVISTYKWIKSFRSRKGQNLLVVKMFDTAAWIAAYGLTGMTSSFSELLPPYQNVVLSVIGAASCVISILWIYAMIMAFPKMIQEELEQKYAHIDYQKVFAK